MKATHHIKLNGRWYAPGEELPEEKKTARAKKAPEKAPETPAEEQTEAIVPEITAAEPEKAEEPATDEPKQRNASRRKVGK